MADVVVATSTASRKRINATGDKWQYRYVISGVSGNTLQTRLQRIQQVLFGDTTITKATWDAAGVITFTSSGAFTTVPIIVIGGR